MNSFDKLKDLLISRETKLHNSSVVICATPFFSTRCCNTCTERIPQTYFKRKGVSICRNLKRIFGKKQKRLLIFSRIFQKKAKLWLLCIYQLLGIKRLQTRLGSFKKWGSLLPRSKGGKMGNLIKIGNQKIAVKEFNGKRVITFKDIDTVHERPEGTAGRNFRENKKHFIEGEDYFRRNSSEAKTEFDIIAPNGLVLITEQGYLMLVKSFTDDLAWEVQRQLVKNYFRVKNNYEMPNMTKEMRAILLLDTRTDQMEKRMDKLEFEIPLYGSEADELSNHVKRKGVQVLGGKDSEAYQDTVVRSMVYRDIYSQIKREFNIYDDSGKPKSYKALKRKYLADAHDLIDCYEPPRYLEEMIEDINLQISFEKIG